MSDLLTVLQQQVPLSRSQKRRPYVSGQIEALSGALCQIPGSLYMKSQTVSSDDGSAV